MGSLMAASARRSYRGVPMKSDPGPEPMTDVLSTFRLPEKTSFAAAWVSKETQFQTKKSIAKWEKTSDSEEGEDAYFACGYLRRTIRKVAKGIEKTYRKWRKEGRPCCMFAGVKHDSDLDQWRVRRENLHFRWADKELEPFVVRFGLDPETFEYSVKPVPLNWFYNERFVDFLEAFLWQVPMKLGLSSSMAHGGAQFSLSA